MHTLNVYEFSCLPGDGVFDFVPQPRKFEHELSERLTRPGVAVGESEARPVPVLLLCWNFPPTPTPTPTCTCLFIRCTMRLRFGPSQLRQLICSRKSDCLGCAVLLCLVCLTLLASFFLPSHLSFRNMYVYTCITRLSVPTIRATTFLAYQGGPVVNNSQ